MEAPQSQRGREWTGGRYAKPWHQPVWGCGVRSKWSVGPRAYELSPTMNIRNSYGEQGYKGVFGEHRAPPKDTLKS